MHCQATSDGCPHACSTHTKAAIGAAVVVQGWAQTMCSPSQHRHSQKQGMLPASDHALAVPDTGSLLQPNTSLQPQGNTPRCCVTVVTPHTAAADKEGLAAAPNWLQPAFELNRQGLPRAVPVVHTGCMSLPYDIPSLSSDMTQTPLCQYPAPLAPPFFFATRLAPQQNMPGARLSCPGSAQTPPPVAAPVPQRQCHTRQAHMQRVTR